MKKLFIAIAALALFAPRVSADEGMWLLPLLDKLNLRDMQAKGLKLTAEDIYNANGGSLKDAIVQFGGGCTGEIVSPEGLLFTNYHCGYGNIQSLSSLENDYLKNGFWAMSRAEEIHAPGLTVRFVRTIEEVTQAILAGVGDDTPQADRESIVKANTEALTAQLESDNPGMSIQVRAFFGGNQYFAFVTEVYRDIRLVGTPPYSVGKFGNETDNWMYPRHTGDFCIFRVYAGSDNKPADYSPDNVPYKAPVHLKISAKGYNAGDFAMVMGFPGTTTRYMTSYEIDQMLEVDNPNRIYVRGVRQDILKENMNASDEIRIKYAAKYQSSSNYWKNSIGMSRGVRNLNVKGQKQAIEERFTRWAEASPERARFTRALPLIREAVEGRTPLMARRQMLTETMGRGMELVNVAGISGALNPDVIGTEKGRAAAMEAIENFYKDYDEGIDRLVAVKMLGIVMDSVPEVIPESFMEVYRANGSRMEELVDYIYDNSVFSNRDKLMAYIDGRDYSGISNDPAVILMKSVMTATGESTRQLARYNQMYREGHRLYVEGILAMEPEVSHYPDANLTIRLTYGTVEPYWPRDAVFYNHYTTADGVIEKEDPTNPFDFTVSDRFKELYYAKDFGRYESDGKLPVNFLTTNDITGGNSGSPVLDGEGRLIGLAFDGNWEAMSGDVAFEHRLQRCINLDVRYLLWVVEKYGNAGHLLDEMTIEW